MSFLRNEVKKLISDNKANVSWSSMYLVIVVIIALVLLFTVIKPSYRRAERTVRETQIPK